MGNRKAVHLEKFMKDSMPYQLHNLYHSETTPAKAQQRKTFINNA
jgi:hypothetical protein